MAMTLPMKYFPCVALGLLWLGLGCGLSSARVVSIGIANGGALSFFPATTNIAVNDQVIWTWNTTGIPPHSTTSDTNGIWDSGLFQGPHSYTNMFTSAGTYPYHCTQHVSFGMRGTIAVSAPSLPPQIGITNPLSGAVFTAPANVTIQAAVTNGSGAVTNVQFLVGSGVLTNKTAPPYSATTNNLQAGSYTLSAVATDNNGMKATNAINILVDAPPSVTITNPLSGAVLAAPANVIIKVSASDSDGTVTNVQFLIGSTVLTNETTAPFSIATNNLAAGSYTLSAVAADNNGVKATNSATISVVTPVTVSLTAPARTSPTNFQFSYAANVGLQYIVQRSTNLLATNWLTLATNTAAASSVSFTDTNATVNPGFYRVGRLPSP